MKITFTSNYTDEDGVEHTAGTIREVPDALGNRLIKDGVATRRYEPRGPEQTKAQDVIRDDDTADGEEHDHP